MRNALASSFSFSLLAAIGACGSSSDVTPDAGPDAAPPPGNFTCVGVPWPSSGIADPLPLHGKVNEWTSGAAIGGATVEFYSMDDGSLIGQTTSASAPMSAKGGYTYDLVTGGIPRATARKISVAGRVDTYSFDPYPQYNDFSWGLPSLTQADYDGLYATAGLTNDGTTGIVAVEVCDCNPPGSTKFMHIEGATVDVPPGARVIYATAGAEFVDLSLTATTTDGFALLVGVPPGPLDVTIHAGPITYRPWSITVHPNAFTLSPRHP